MTNIGILVHSFVTSVINRVKEEAGQDTLEWALIGGLVALALILGFALLGPYVISMVNGVGRCIDFDSATVCTAGP